jgi:hypothetical protein
MTDGVWEAFLAGERPDDVLVYLAAGAVSDIETLAEYGQRVDDGVLFVLDGERGRRVAGRALGTDPMDFARTAMGRNGDIDLDALVGTCPAAESDGTATHSLQQVFAFAEEQNQEVGGRYAEGDVIHAYATCACGTAYSDRWVATES